MFKIDLCYNKNLVDDKHVSGWDDPRMPTLSGLRRRGYTPKSIREFASRIGVAKRDGIIDIALLDHCLREDLNKQAQRAMALAAAWCAGPDRDAGRLRV